MGLGQNWKANGQDSINYTAEDPATHYVDGSNIDDVAPFDITPNQWMHVEYVIDLKGENNGFNGDATYDMYIDNQLVLTGEYHDATEKGERVTIPVGPGRPHVQVSGREIRTRRRQRTPGCLYRQRPCSAVYTTRGSAGRPQQRRRLQRR